MERTFPLALNPVNQMVAPCCPRSSVRSWWETEPARIAGRVEMRRVEFDVCGVEAIFHVGRNQTKEKGEEEVKIRVFMDDPGQSRECRKSQSSSCSYLV